MLQSFGKVTVAAGGTPSRATANRADPSEPVPTQSFVVQALPGNTGLVYIFSGGANFSGDHRTSLDRCIGILPAPTSATNGPFSSASFSVPNIPNGLNLADIWFDVGVSGDGVIVAATAG